MTGPIVIVGDCLLDVDIEGSAERLCPEAPAPVVDVRAEHRRPGGAGLAALLAARDGAEVVLVTALADDASGHHLTELLPEGVRVVRLPLRGATVRKTRVRAGGQTLVRIDSGDGLAQIGADRVLRRRLSAVLRDARAVLVSDYGRGVAEACRPFLESLAVPVVWDPHSRGPTPLPGCALVTPNEAEATRLCALPYGTPEEVALRLTGDLGVGAVAVTLGERGAVLAHGDARPVSVPPPEVAFGRDPCGAGDRFAVTATLALADGVPVGEAVTAAVGAATRFVKAGGAAAVRSVSPADIPPPRTSANGTFVRAPGSRLVATGGCFDLLHAGHVSLLRRARALGDALVVCVNSDASVRRLKGPDRPVISQQDRVEVLRALECVDAVVVFDDDTPAEVIERLRPEVWVKGGDYTEADLPEADAVRRCGGEVVILPVVPGYSTTGLITALRTAPFH
ncbi:D-glycero-beta-D-manno-heptose 1-phosphate adenylyltransferase [Streptosporangium saharense]|uniref:D-glycero-beta-D-manno-heptose 1-phosphate adenylyltransferase n=1 Tax=Streptosporangium saharense TaxID=1706840 RepID=A0A7W7QP97_9ACTN|nr:D-glycero-beta-D-manno-heptose 1-phosphate adenylyltransferase [Streptosporangium saharense]MBB4917242.1 rfaE bifunctional protein nucleotidyltransferase chain/domain/rfaE bifunctional protein kinase chain/domain [Streptosporangium saharense]